MTFSTQLLGRWAFVAWLPGAVACSSSSTPDPPPQAGERDAALDQGAEQGAVGDAALEAAPDAATVDSGPKPGDVTSTVSTPTSCNEVCAGAGLACKNAGKSGVGNASFEREDGTFCGRGILTCDTEVWPTESCAGKPSVRVLLTCRCS